MGNAKRCVATPACSGRKHVMRTCVRGRTIVSDRVNSTGTSDHPRTCAYPACGGARHHLRHRRKAVKVNPPRNAGFVAGCCMPFQRSAPFCESGWLPLSDSQTQTHGLPGEMQAVSKSKDRLRAVFRSARMQKGKSARHPTRDRSNRRQNRHFARLPLRRCFSSEADERKPLVANRQRAAKRSTAPHAGLCGWWRRRGGVPRRDARRCTLRSLRRAARPGAGCRWASPRART